MKYLYSLFITLSLVSCINIPLQLQGGSHMPSFSDVQKICQLNQDYGKDNMLVYSAVYDAYVAYKKGALPKDEFCHFQQDILRQYQLSIAGKTTILWSDFLNQMRAQAVSWRSRVDTSLRGF